MRIGYARVSTTGQERDGNSLTDQERRLREAGAEVIVAEAFTGTSLDRPRFSKMLSELSAGDTLLVTKLDRFARAIEGAKLVSELVERGVRVHILDMGIAESTPMGRLVVTILFAIAEYERYAIMERLDSGKAVKRATDPNYKEGRKRIELGDERFADLVKACRDESMTVNQCCAELGISRATWYRRCRELGVA